MEGQLNSMMSEKQTSNFVRHEDCPDCGSSDARSFYDDGHYYCYSCQTHTPAEPGSQGAAPAAGPLADQDQAKRQDLLQTTFQAIEARRLSEETCEKFGYLVTAYKGTPVRSQPTATRPAAQSPRRSEHRQTVQADRRYQKLTLFGSRCGAGANPDDLRRRDRCHISKQVQGHKWATVSLPNGASSAVRAIRITGITSWALNRGANAG